MPSFKGKEYSYDKKGMKEYVSALKKKRKKKVKKEYETDYSAVPPAPTPPAGE